MIFGDRFYNRKARLCTPERSGNQNAIAHSSPIVQNRRASLITIPCNTCYARGVW